MSDGDPLTVGLRSPSPLDGTPTVGFGRLWHVGTLNRADKGRVRSYEGTCGLSVSTHPDAWVRIAKLGGVPTWQLNREGGPGRFCDFVALDDRARQRVRAWGVAHGYVTPTVAWKVIWTDVETGEQRWLFCASQVDVDAEAGELDDAGVSHRVEQVDAFAPAELLRDRFPASTVGTLDEELVIVCAERTTDLDGVWFGERLDPDVLSAPRGLIFDRALGCWRTARRDDANHPS